MSAGLIVADVAPGVRLLTLDRPARRNALSTALLADIAAALSMADRDGDVRAVVVTGGATVFAAGAEIDEIAALGADDPIDSPRYVAWKSIRSFAKPLVGAVEGWCLGAGLELAMCCDIVVAGDTARLGLPETNLGIIPGGGGTAMLPQIVGRALAMQMILTGRPIDAPQALRSGLVAEVVPAGGALARAVTIATDLAERAPLALAAAKASVRDAFALLSGDQFRAERVRFVGLLGTDDKHEGIAAFRERRAPVWQGR